MMQKYPFYDLGRTNLVINLFTLIPGSLCITGLVLGGITLFNIYDYPKDQLLSALDINFLTQLRMNEIVRKAQISCTGILVFFYFYWIYYASRNMVSMFEKHTPSLGFSVRLSFRLLRQSLRMTTIINQMRYKTIPEGHSHVPDKWLLPAWWSTLMGANVCKIAAVYFFFHANTVIESAHALCWIMVAYGLYLIFYILTVRMLKEVAWLQKLYWQHKLPSEAEACLDEYHSSHE